MSARSEKAFDPLAIFKSKIKQWKTPNCQCRLCKLYVPDLGFIN